MIEIGQYPLLEKLITEDYNTYSGDTLERYFGARLIEDMRYRAIGNWWDVKGYTDAKGNHQQCEIDIVAISADDKEAFIYEVKRNAEKYDAKLMEEKVAFFVQKEKRMLHNLSVFPTFITFLYHGKGYNTGFRRDHR